ncbi:MAG: hypothetical protein QMB63_05540 [Clostridiaceae bacterium]
MEKIIDSEKIEFIRQQAIDCFNKTWDYLEMKDRDSYNDIEMIHCAHTSRYLWGLVGGDLERERGEWLISKVYYNLGIGDRALVHANACHDICVRSGIADFDLSFAYECLANAYKLLGDEVKYVEFKQKAIESLKGIADPGDLEYTTSEIMKI